MTAKQLVDILALELDKSTDIPFKRAAVLQAIAYRAVLLKQQVDSNQSLLQQYLVKLENIPLIEGEGKTCFTITKALPAWVTLKGKEFYLVEVLDEHKCCLHTDLYESSVARSYFNQHSKFGSKLAYYSVANNKVTVYGINKNAKYINVYYIPNSSFEVTKYQKELSLPLGTKPCNSPDDVEIEDTFYDGVSTFMAKFAAVYQGNKDADIKVSPDIES